MRTRANGLVRHTGVLGLRDDLCQQLGKVGNVLAQEACLKDKGLPSVVCGQLASKKLALAGDSKCGSFRSVL